MDNGVREITTTKDDLLATTIFRTAGKGSAGFVHEVVLHNTFVDMKYKIRRFGKHKLIHYTDTDADATKSTGNEIEAVISRARM